MADERSNNIKLGAFVLVGSLVLIVGLYLLGNKRELFSKTIQVSAVFSEVSGLRKGNNVRYTGIDVGTVKGLEIISDTSVMVHMTLKESAAQHIRTTAIARIASDGLMGNKLVNLEPGTDPGGPISDGAVLPVGRALDTEAMLRTLSGSNDNLAAITADLREVTRRISGENGLLSIFSDTTIAGDLHLAIQDLRGTATNARLITERVDHVVRELEQGRGALGALAADPRMESDVREMVISLKLAADSLEQVTGHLARFSHGLNDPKGALHMLSRDTAVANDLRRIVDHLDTSSATLNEDLKALQENFLFRRYFKKRQREQK